MNLTLNTDSLVLIETAPAIDSGAVNTVAVVGDRHDYQPGAWAPIVVPTVCSIIVFVIGWVLTRYFKKKDEKKSRNTYKALVIGWIRMIETSEEQFIQSIKDISASIGESDNMQPEPFSVPQAIPHRLNEFPLEKLTDVFLNSKKGNERIRSEVHFFNIVSGFEYLSKMAEQVQSFYERYNKETLDLCQEWNTVYSQFVDSLNSSLSLKYYKPIKNSWDSAFRENKDSIKVHQNHIVQFANQADSLKDKTIIAFINRLGVILEQRKAINTGFAQLFESMADFTHESYQSMREAADYFDDKKQK